MISGMTLKAIIFDMDGVLCDSEPYIIRAASMMFWETYKTRVLPEDFIPFTGTGEARFITGVAEKYNLQLDIERDKQQTYTNYIQLIRGELTPLPGTLAFIEDAKARGLKLAVASSADRRKVNANIKQLGLDPNDFGVIITGSDVTRFKPDPQCFQIAADGLNIPYHACLVVEDAVAGVKAGKAAGCRVLGLLTTFPRKALREAGADYLAENLGDVANAAPESLT